MWCLKVVMPKQPFRNYFIVSIRLFSFINVFGAGLTGCEQHDRTRPHVLQGPHLLRNSTKIKRWQTSHSLLCCILINITYLFPIIQYVLASKFAFFICTKRTRMKTLYRGLLFLWPALNILNGCSAIYGITCLTPFLSRPVWKLPFAKMSS